MTGACRLTGGVSADVYRLDYLDASEGPQSVVLRVHGERHGGMAAALEYALLSALFETGLPVAEPLLVDDSRTLLPYPFLVIAFVAGDSIIDAVALPQRLDALANGLSRVHGTSLTTLPELPARLDPLPEVFEFLPSGAQWQPLETALRAVNDRISTAFEGPVKLLHGDYWPENLLWRDDRLVAMLDWEDAAFGDPLSDVAGAGLELRYLFGREAMVAFIAAYERKNPALSIDPARLALWQVYVAGAAQRYMGQWGLPAKKEAHMRQEALATIADAAAVIVHSFGS